MKTEKKIFITFILNLVFAVFEFIGGIFTGSVAIASDALHDFGDAVGIGASYFLEKKSKKQPDEKYTYGYARFSVLGSVISTLILLIGSITVLYFAIKRIIVPTEINYRAMIPFAVVGLLVNLFAVFLTKRGKSLNQKAVNLHMLEDVFGWALVLICAIIMRFTALSIIDAIASILISLFILLHALKNLKSSLEIFMEKIPNDVSVENIIIELKNIGVLDVHHIHVWTMDGVNNYATMHVVLDGTASAKKEEIKRTLFKLGIGHCTLELETLEEVCHDKHCHVEICNKPHHCHCH